MKSKQPKKELAGKRGSRPQAARLEAQGDTYRKKAKKVATKLPDVTLCPGCKAIFRGGRWRWPTVAKPTGARKELCPACQRIRGKYPAGEVTLRGEFARAHRDESLGVAKQFKGRIEVR